MGFGRVFTEGKSLENVASCSVWWETPERTAGRGDVRHSHPGDLADSAGACGGMAGNGAPPSLPEADPAGGDVALPESVCGSRVFPHQAHVCHCISFPTVPDPLGPMSQEGWCDRQQTSLPGCQPCPGSERCLYEHNKTDRGQATPRLLLPLLPRRASPLRLDVHRGEGRGERGPQELP